MKIPEGYDPEIQAMRLTLDPVNVGPCLQITDRVRVRLLMRIGQRSSLDSVCSVKYHQYVVTERGISPQGNERCKLSIPASQTR